MSRYPATKLPRCGVEMNTTRETSGSGSTNKPASEEVARRVGQSELIERLAADGVPDAIAAADALHLDQQAPLAVPDQHHPAKRGILAVGVEPRHRGGQRVAQAERGQGDRIVGVVLEEPELEPAADLLVGLEAVVHLRPAHDAGRRAVHEDDGDEPGPVGRGGDERRPLRHDPGESAEVAEHLELHDRHAGERERQRRGRLALERNALAGDRDRVLVPGEVQLQRGRERLPLDESAPGMRDAEQRRERHLEPRRHHVTAGGRGLDGPRRGRERGADARPPIPHRQTVHLELRDGDEADTARGLPHAARRDRTPPRSVRRAARTCRRAERPRIRPSRRRPRSGPSCTGPRRCGGEDRTDRDARPPSSGKRNA